MKRFMHYSAHCAKNSAFNISDENNLVCSCHPELAEKSVEAKPKRDFTPLLGLLTLPPNILLSTCHPELVSGSY